MKDNTKLLIDKSVQDIIERCANNQKISSLIDKHDKKLHFIPTEYRVLGGLLQSMNIQFGNFIEILMSNLVSCEERYEIIEKYSGKKSNSFSLAEDNERLIDSYITKCQTETFDLEQEFELLKKQLFLNNKREGAKVITFKHDIDLLFKSKDNNKIYYLEIKYNDDHDTGKFVDINRKFIKTYAYLLSEFDLNDHNDLVPILFFFNNKKMKGNIYIPEQSNIMRGQKFFDNFLTTEYLDVDLYLTDLSKRDETIASFDALYRKIRGKK